MEIHKPKPWHGWREFLKEYLIIVVGVLTALGAEQTVDFLHQRHMAEQARNAIRSEAESNLAWMAFRLRSDDCVTARIAEVQRLLLQWSPKTALPAPLWIGRPITAVIRSAALDSASSTGRTALLSPDEQARFATLRYYFQSLEENQTHERTVWGRLQVLETRPPLQPNAPGRASHRLAGCQELPRPRDRRRAASITGFAGAEACAGPELQTRRADAAGLHPAQDDAREGARHVLRQVRPDVGTLAASPEPYAAVSSDEVQPVSKPLRVGLPATPSDLLRRFRKFL